MQTELNGTSVIFVKVAPGYVERTLTTLRGKPFVASAEAVFGRHDIAVAGNFRDSDALRGFQSEVQLLDHVRGFRSYPALWNWAQSKTNGHPISAYVLIRSSNPKQAISELEKLTQRYEMLCRQNGRDPKAAQRMLLVPFFVHEDGREGDRTTGAPRSHERTSDAPLVRALGSYPSHRQ